MADEVNDKRAKAIGEFLVAFSRLRDYPGDRERLVRQAVDECGLRITNEEDEMVLRRYRFEHRPW